MLTHEAISYDCITVGVPCSSGAPIMAVLAGAQLQKIKAFVTQVFTSEVFYTLPTVFLSLPTFIFFICNALSLGANCEGDDFDEETEVLKFPVLGTADRSTSRPNRFDSHSLKTGVRTTNHNWSRNIEQTDKLITERMFSQSKLDLQSLSGCLANC